MTHVPERKFDIQTDARDVPTQKTMEDRVSSQLSARQEEASKIGNQTCSILILDRKTSQCEEVNFC